VRQEENLEGSRWENHGGFVDDEGIEVMGLL
jgi:hypothetical protein